MSETSEIQAPIESRNDVANRLELAGGSKEIKPALSELDRKISNMLGRCFQGESISGNYNSRAGALLTGINRVLENPYGDAAQPREIADQKEMEGTAYLIKAVAKMGKVNEDGSVTLNMVDKNASSDVLETTIPANRTQGF